MPRALRTPPRPPSPRIEEMSERIRSDSEPPEMSDLDHPTGPEIPRLNLSPAATTRGDGGGPARPSARAAEIMRRRRAGQGDRAAKALVARFISASREDADRVRRGGAPFRVAAACADLRRLGAGAALGGLYGAAGCAAALQALDIACGAVCGVLASVTPGPATGAAEVDARRALRRRLEAIAGGGGVDAATARTAASRLAPPRPPPPPKRRRSAVTDLILGS